MEDPHAKHRENVRVFVRVKPLSPEEGSASVIDILPDGKTVVLLPAGIILFCYWILFKYDLY
jgi:hypothetical protein